MIIVILSGYWEHYPNRVNYATFLVNSMSLEMSPPPPFHPSCTWVKYFDPLILPAKKQKNRARLRHKLRRSLLLAVECHYGDTNLYNYKFEVHNIFAILGRGVFRTLSNVYGGALCKNSQRVNTVNRFCKNAPSQMFSWVLNTPLLVFIQFVQKWGINVGVIKLEKLSHFD